MIIILSIIIVIAEHPYTHTHTHTPTHIHPPTSHLQSRPGREATHDRTRVGKPRQVSFYSLTGHSPAIVSINITIPSLSFPPSQPVHLSLNIDIDIAAHSVAALLPRCLECSRRVSPLSQSPPRTHASNNPSHDQHPAPPRSISHLVTQIFFLTATGYPYNPNPPLSSMLNASPGVRATTPCINT